MTIKRILATVSAAVLFSLVLDLPANAQQSRQNKSIILKENDMLKKEIDSLKLEIAKYQTELQRTDSITNELLKQYETTEQIETDTCTIEYTAEVFRHDVEHLVKDVVELRRCVRKAVSCSDLRYRLGTDDRVGIRCCVFCIVADNSHEASVFRRVDLAVVHVAVPVVAFLDLVTSDAVSKVADDTGLLEGLVVDRDDTHARGFEP